MVKKVPIMPVYYGIKKFYHWRQWVCSFTRFSGLTVFSSVSTVPRLLHLPARRDSCDLALLCEVRKSRQACSIVKRLKRRFLGRAPGSPLAHFWSCRQYYYQNEVRYRAIARFSSKLLLGPAVNNSLRGHSLFCAHSMSGWLVLLYKQVQSRSSHAGNTNARYVNWSFTISSVLQCNALV